MIRCKLTRDRKGLLIWCPACEETHVMGLNIWTWDGSLTDPTLYPIVAHESLRFGPNRVQFNEIPKDAKLADFPAHAHRCIFFLHKGTLFFGDTCTHAYAGHKMDLPKLDVA